MKMYGEVVQVDADTSFPQFIENMPVGACSESVREPNHVEMKCRPILRLHGGYFQG